MRTNEQTQMGKEQGHQKAAILLPSAQGQRSMPIRRDGEAGVRGGAGSRQKGKGKEWLSSGGRSTPEHFHQTGVLGYSYELGRVVKRRREEKKRRRKG